MKASVTRDSISGFHSVNDIPDGEYSIQELSRLAQAQADALSAAVKRDQGGVENFTDKFTEEGNPALGDAMEREVRPSYFDEKSKADRFGTI